MCHNRSFLPVTLVLSLGVMPGAIAAPSVRVLGQKTAGSGNTVQTVKRVDANQLSRAASVRNTGTVVKPVSITKNTVTKTTTENKVPSESAARLSIGKYIHSTGVKNGVIKPNGSASGVSPSSGDVVVLTERIDDIDARVEAKQDRLEAGDGIVISDNVISVDTSVGDLSGRVDTLEEQVSGKADTSDFEAYKNEVNATINEYFVESNDTVYDAVSGERKYVTMAYEFDEDILK